MLLLGQWPDWSVLGLYGLFACVFASAAATFLPLTRKGFADAASDLAIDSRRLGKTFQLYERPIDRLKQMLMRGRRRYFKEFVALHDVSFELKKGEVLGLVGRNGAGKSTLLQLICGTLSPTNGAVTVRGRVAALLELGAGFNPDFTGRENIYLNASILGLSKAEIDDR